MMALSLFDLIALSVVSGESATPRAQPDEQHRFAASGMRRVAPRDEACHRGADPPSSCRNPATGSKLYRPEPHRGERPGGDARHFLSAIDREKFLRYDAQARSLPFQPWSRSLASEARFESGWERPRADPRPR
jgi:hypothetical protein